MTWLPLSRPQRVVVTLCCAAVVASGVFTTSRTAHADQFFPIPGPPTITSLTAPAANSASAIQPKYPDSGGSGASGGIYEVSAVVATNATLAVLDTVTMCWYKNDIDNADTRCDALNPQDSFQMVWTEATAAASDTDKPGAGFAVSVGTTSFTTNNYSNQVSVVETTSNTASYDPAAQSMTIRFKFRVSNAMLAGDDWAVRMVAVYDENLCNGNPCDGLTEAARTGSASLSGRHVAYWGEMTTAWEPLGFGVVGEGLTSSLKSATEFAYVANDDSDYTISGTAFSYDPDGPGGTAADVLAAVAGTPASKEVKMECQATTPLGTGYKVFTSASATVPGSAVALGAPILPTGESLNEAGQIDCRLTYGSGASYALKAYSSAVTLALAQR